MRPQEQDGSGLEDFVAEASAPQLYSDGSQQGPAGGWARERRALEPSSRRRDHHRSMADAASPTNLLSAELPGRCDAVLIQGMRPVTCMVSNRPSSEARILPEGGVEHSICPSKGHVRSLSKYILLCASIIQAYLPSHSMRYVLPLIFYFTLFKSILS